MADFEDAEIEINHYSDKWGPFIFHIPSCSSQTANDGLIPFGATLSSATVRCFVGIVPKGASLDDYVEVTELVETDPAVAVEVNSIRVYFQYPGSTYKNKRITVIFECLLSTGAKQAFFFNSVVIN